MKISFTNKIIGAGLLLAILIGLPDFSVPAGTGGLQPVFPATTPPFIQQTPPVLPAPFAPLAPIVEVSSELPAGLTAEPAAELAAAAQEQTTAAKALAASGKPYTIAWLSDTQHYSSSHPETFTAMTSYLFKKQQSLNLGYVVHTGDIVSTANSEKQWNNAKQAMNLLGGIPYGMLAGNHDVGKKVGYKNYSKYFGQQQLSLKAYYGGTLADDRGHYDLLTLGSTQYLFVYLGYQPGEEAISWANEVFQKYPDRVGILCAHAYLDSRSNLVGIGKLLQQRVVRPNPNVYMVLCGHRYTEDCVPVSFDDDGDGQDDRTVYQCIANYQNIDKQGGSGYIRFMEIDESKGTIRFYTYSPLLLSYRSAPEKAANKSDTLPIPWQ